MPELRAWTWSWLVATTLAKALLAVVICLGLWGALPAAIGWQPTTVSSGSMLPRLHVGDVAVSRPVGATPPALDTVLLFDDPDHPGRLRLHRFVGVAEDGRLVTRGDANPGDDSSPVALAAVRGIGTLRVPWVGLPVVWLRERAWLPLSTAVAVLLGLTAVAAQSRRFGFPDAGPETAGDDDHDRSGTPTTAGAADPARGASPTAVGSRTGAARTGTALLVAALLGLVPAAPADAAFASRTVTRATAAAATYFSCASGVAASVPFLWYRLDETSTATAATDSSGGARNGTYGAAGKTSASRACARDTGSAMTFNGTTGYLSSPLIGTAQPQTFSLSVWFRTATAVGGKLVGYGNAASGPSGAYDRHLYLTNAGNVVFGVYPGAARTVASPLPYNNNAWHQAVATLSTAGMRLYLDGALVASDPTVTSAESSASGYVRVAYDNLDGWPGAPTSRFFAGTLDDVVVHLSALTATQVDALYQAGI